MAVSNPNIPTSSLLSAELPGRTILQQLGDSYMPRRSDGLVLRGKTWWLDFYDNGELHRERLGKNINRSVAGEIAAVKRAAILKGEAGIGKKKKDLLYDDARNEFLKWVKANKKPR